MNEAKEILDALPKSREYYTTVRSAELARLRKIAECFAAGDSDALKRVIDYMNYMYPRSSPYFGCAADIVMLGRLQAAAKLAEDLCK